MCPLCLNVLFYLKTYNNEAAEWQLCLLNLFFFFLVSRRVESKVQPRSSLCWYTESKRFHVLDSG